MFLLLFLKIIAPIPKIEAAVPSTVLADMFGKATSDVFKRLDLGANGWMHFTNAAKGIFGAFASTAPVLAPCLGLLGVGFGFINKELNSVSPAQIMAEVNKAIDKVVEETNRRFEVMQEYVDQSVRGLMEETMNDDYKGQFETWNECLELPTKDLIDDCQIDSARSVNSLKYKFMFQKKFSENADLSTAEVKAVELQLPILKKWADFHFLVLAALMKTYKEDSGEVATAMYEKYKIDFIQAGNLYVAYMEWALTKIRKARVEDNTKSPSLDCKGYDDNLGRYYWFPTNRNLRTSSRKCTFKCDSLRPDYCDLTTTRDCTTSTDNHCKLCSGLFCSVKRPLELQHYYLDSSQVDKSKEICRNYMDKLTSELNAFWQREIEVFLPIFKETIADLDDEPENGEEDGAQKRQGPDDGSGQKLSSKAKKISGRVDKIVNRDDEETENSLKGTSGSQSLEEYLNTVKKNNEMLQKKMKARKKLRKKKINRS